MNPDSTEDSKDSTTDFQSLAAPIIERAPLPMVEVEGPLHLVCFVNAAFCRLLQKKREELLGKPFGQIVRNGEKCTALLDRVYETGEFETHVDPDHSAVNPTYWLYAMWPALGENAKPERVVIQTTKSSDFHLDIAAMNEALLISALRQHELRDEAEKSNARSLVAIADQKVTEGALREVNNQLRNATLLVERASKSKDDFLAALSHELRTPLTPVLAIATFLREDKRLPVDVRKQLGTIERNIALEARLIDDLLDLTKISHGKLHLRSEVCDTHFLIGLAIEIVQEEAGEKGIELEKVFTSDHSDLMVDPARFQQVVWNLLRNSVKFTPRGGKITIRTTIENQGGNGKWLRIEVADTGIGIDSSHLEDIFLPFDQGELTGNHRFGGVGLGLAIARAVVLLHGGRITAKSPGVNLGSTFVVELPGIVEAAQDIVNTDRASAQGTISRETIFPLRLLLVEDHAATLEALSQILRRDGHEVTPCTNIAIALAAAVVKPFDLVISDLGLPDGSGIQLMETLRASYPGLRGVALSGYGMEEDIARSLAAGFVKHLIKPVAIAELRRTLAVLGRPNV